MKIIQICEKQPVEGGFDIEVILDGKHYPLKVQRPCTDKEEAALEYYFESYVSYPYLIDARVQQAEKLVYSYGKSLFDQLFLADHKLYSKYKQFQNNLESVRFEIVGGIDFQAWHWETLYDTELEYPIAVKTAMVRRDVEPHPVEANISEFPWINLLLVTARPGGASDVSYRTISRPLVESLQSAGLKVNIEVVRPGTYEALHQALNNRRDAHAEGYYHILHFDGHGGLMTWEEFQQNPTVTNYAYFRDFGRHRLERYEGKKGFIFFETERRGQSDPVEADQFATLVRQHNIPVVILNACQSAKQRGATESSLASRMMRSGVQLVLAMGYSVTVSAAEILIPKLYEQLFERNNLGQAISLARNALYQWKERQGAYMKVDLEDWMLPVVYTNQEVNLNLREMKEEELNEFYSRVAYEPSSRPLYGFLGRDLDILEIERRLIHMGNILLIQGMGGVGKTSLLNHLGEWWQKTGWAQKVFYFGYDEKAHALEQMLHLMAAQLFGPYSTEMKVFQQPSLLVKTNLIRNALNQQPHLLILDNLESITGQKLSVGGQLNPNEQAQIHDFLKMLKNGKTKVLLGSRSPEKWLERGTFDGNSYELPGLDPLAAAKLAEEVIRRSGGDKYLGQQINPQSREKHQKHIDELLQLLGNFPLPIEIILGNLRDKSPFEILTALREGDIQISGEGESKTESVLQCVAYSHQNLSVQEQKLLLILAPFSGHFFNGAFDNYLKELSKQEALKDFDFSRWPQALQEAKNMGLIREGELPGYFQLQPVFPYFLRNNLLQNEGLKTGIEEAFREHCFSWAAALDALIRSKNPQEKMAGQAMATLEVENFNKAIDISLERGVPFRRLIQCISGLFDAMQNKQGRIAFLREVIEKIEKNADPGVYSEENLLLTIWLATSLLEFEPKVAGELYEKCLSFIDEITYLESGKKQKIQAGIYHNLGRVKQEQREYASAESHYHKALEISMEFNDRYNQANTYCELGIVKQKQREYASAESNYRKALEIFMEFNDRYQQAMTFHNLGNVKEEQREYASAESHYRKALEIKIDFNDRYSQASTYHQLGGVKQKQRDYASAESNYRKALEIFMEFNDRYSQAKTYHSLGRVKQEKGDYASAESNYRKALEIKIDFNDRYSQAKTYHQLGSTKAEQRDYVSAESNYRKALEIYIDFNDRFLQAMTYHHMGMVKHEQREYAAAESNYRKALEVFIDFNDRYSQAKTYHHLGRVKEEQREYAAAESNYRKALEVFIDFNDRYSQAMTYHHLGNIKYLERDDASAESNYCKALEIYIDFNDRYSQASTFGQLGLLLRELERFKDAFENSLAAFTIFLEFNDQHNSAMAIRELKVLAEKWDAVAVLEGIEKTTDMEAKQVLELWKMENLNP